MDRQQKSFLCAIHHTPTVRYVPGQIKGAGKWRRGGVDRNRKWKCKFPAVTATATATAGPLAQPGLYYIATLLRPLQQFNFLSNFHNLQQIVSECCQPVRGLSLNFMQLAAAFAPQSAIEAQ